MVVPARPISASPAITGTPDPSHIPPALTIVDTPGDSESFEHYSERLVRHLFEAGLQLQVLRAIFDGHHSTPDDIRAAGAAVGGVLEDLDTLIRDTELAMLTLIKRRSS
ncbi:hypothetical protein GPX89_16215 [Nocardia sp. ET3-3]|uniref:Uncharacterized protein n=1 Tax=Nocardia terrae TaxID=2675851 RepID=A0A7K1UWL1_9NOCA|nr:hypothetical protein [Nocardia terrae]MVU78783.1 hypothetical protein [Nocardia terrae]